MKKSIPDCLKLELYSLACKIRKGASSSSSHRPSQDRNEGSNGKEIAQDFLNFLSKMSSDRQGSAHAYLEDKKEGIGGNMCIIDNETSQHDTEQEDQADEIDGEDAKSDSTTNLNKSKLRKRKPNTSYMRSFQRAMVSSKSDLKKQTEQEISRKPIFGYILKLFCNDLITKKELAGFKDEERQIAASLAKRKFSISLE